jgi:hypothetical protein
MMAQSFKAGLMAAALLLSTQTGAWSGDGGAIRHESRRQHFHPQADPHTHDRNHGRDQIGGEGLPSVISGLGTFAGSLSALRVRGNGIYFASDFTRTGNPGETLLAPRPKVISVGVPENAGQACAYEAGVCVIRGGR